MENLVYVCNIAISILVVHCVKEDIRKWFYYFVILTAFGIQNIFVNLTSSIYVRSLDVYMDANSADLVYYGIVLLVTFVTMFVCRERKTVQSLFKCTAIPILSFCLLNSEYQVCLLVSLVLVSVLMVSLIVQVIMLRKKYQQEQKHSIKKIVCRFISITQNRITKVMLVATISCVVLAIIDESFISDELASDMERIDRYRYLSGELIEEINRYDDVSTDRKAQILKEVVASEADYLGITSSYSITFDALPEGTYGWFDRSRMVIVIDKAYVDTESFEASLQVCLHEVYHLYQYELVGCLDWEGINSDLALIAEISQWKREYKDYKTTSVDGYEEYAQQLLEVSAREFSEETARIYLDMVYGTYNSGNNDEGKRGETLMIR